MARYEKSHKEETRRQIVDIAAARFRRDGVAASGLAGLMGEAGLTHGGFYAHFASKDELVGAALATAFSATRASLERHVAKVPPEQALETIIAIYLGMDHCQQPERGCAAAALIEEIARGGADNRAIFAGQVQLLVALIGRHLPPGGSRAERQQRAEGVFAALLGALQLARVAGDSKQAKRFLSAGCRAAMAAAQPFA